MKFELYKTGLSNWRFTGCLLNGTDKKKLNIYPNWPPNWRTLWDHQRKLLCCILVDLECCSRICKERERERESNTFLSVPKTRGVTPLSSWEPCANKKNLLFLSCITKIGQNFIDCFSWVDIHGIYYIVKFDNQTWCSFFSRKHTGSGHDEVINNM